MSPGVCWLSPEGVTGEQKPRAGSVDRRRHRVGRVPRRSAVGSGGREENELLAEKGFGCAEQAIQPAG